MPDTLTLYTNPLSRGRIAHWMLEETGMPYSVEMLDYASTMRQKPYLDINPLGKVPAIVHGKRIVTESAAICCYLADAFPDAALAPPAGDRADYYRWMFFCAAPLEAALINQALGVEVPEEKRGMIGYRDVAQMLDVLEAACRANPYLAGERFSAADVSAGSQIGWGMQFGTIEKRPAFVDYWARVSDRDAYRRAGAADDAAMKA